MNIAVYCGSREGRSPLYKKIASALGDYLAHKGMTIITGGSQGGLMGAVTQAALQAGGDVIGVLELPLLCLGEKPHPHLTTLHLVETTAERKHKMSILAEAFLLLPGGIGTVEELFDLWGEIRLEQHKKPLLLLNTAGYFDKLLAFIDQMMQEGFLDSSLKGHLHVIEELPEILQLLHKQEAIGAASW